MSWTRSLADSVWASDVSRGTELRMFKKQK
jgi:hypothetical protein